MTVVAHPDLTGFAPPNERWTAIDDDTYDGAPDAGPQIVGHGATAAEAIADYYEQLEERADALDNAMSAGDGIASFNEPIGGGTPPADYPFCRRDPCPYWRGYCRRDPACNN